MRGTGQPLHLHLLELWLLLQLNSLLRVPYARMHFRPSDQAYWVVACHKARLCRQDLYVPGWTYTSYITILRHCPPAASERLK